MNRGYNLPAKYVLHTVGPQGPVEQELIGCYESIGTLILQHKLKTIALCGVSTGLYKTNWMKTNKHEWNKHKWKTNMNEKKNWN